MSVPRWWLFCECELELEMQQAALDEAEKLLNAPTANADELRDESGS